MDHEHGTKTLPHHREFRAASGISTGIWSQNSPQMQMQIQIQVAAERLEWPGYFTVYGAQKFYEQKPEKENISLPEMINKTENYRKPRCLSWLEHLEKTTCGNTTVVDTLLSRPGLS